MTHSTMQAAKPKYTSGEIVEVAFTARATTATTAFPAAWVQNQPAITAPRNPSGACVKANSRPVMLAITSPHDRKKYWGTCHTTCRGSPPVSAAWSK